MSIPQLLDSLLQKLSLSLRAQGFRSNSLDLNIRHSVHDHRREDILQATNDVAFDDLGSDVGDEGLLRHLDIGNVLVRERGGERRGRTNLVDGKQAVECFFTAEVLHILVIAFSQRVNKLLHVERRG
jgi:hypothetical protein